MSILGKLLVIRLLLASLGCVTRAGAAADWDSTCGFPGEGPISFGGHAGLMVDKAAGGWMPFDGVPAEAVWPQVESAGLPLWGGQAALLC